jgi:hypothetical protein
MASKFGEHFIYIEHAMSHRQRHEDVHKLQRATLDA